MNGRYRAREPGDERELLRIGWLVIRKDMGHQWLYIAFLVVFFLRNYFTAIHAYGPNWPFFMLLFSFVLTPADPLHPLDPYWSIEGATTIEKMKRWVIEEIFKFKKVDSLSQILFLCILGLLPLLFIIAYLLKEIARIRPSRSWMLLIVGMISVPILELLLIGVGVNYIWATIVPWGIYTSSLLAYAFYSMGVERTKAPLAIPITIILQALVWVIIVIRISAASQKPIYPYPFLISLVSFIVTLYPLPIPLAFLGTLFEWRTWRYFAIPLLTLINIYCLVDAFLIPVPTMAVSSQHLLLSYSAPPNGPFHGVPHSNLLSWSIDSIRRAILFRQAVYMNPASSLFSLVLVSATPFLPESGELGGAVRYSKLMFITLLASFCTVYAVMGIVGLILLLSS